MSRGHRQLQRLILQSVRNTRYGCTSGQLAYLTYGGREDAPSDSHRAAVDRAVRRLLDEHVVVERSMLGTERYLFPAVVAAPAATPDIRQCLTCDVRWVSEAGAPHVCCWSCGQPGARLRQRLG